METNIVKVKLWDMDVGYISWDRKAGYSIFEYDEDFIRKGLDISPLDMSINSVRTQKGIPWQGYKEKLYQGLPPMIADSLPDQWGGSIFGAWLRANNIPKRKSSPVDHLSFIGKRGMGALEYEPARDLGEDSAFSVDVENLYQFAKEILSQRETRILDEDKAILWQDLIKISSSPGGKRPKAIIAIDKKNNKVVSGQGNIPESFEHYILKYDDDSSYPYAKLEYVYYLMAIDSGIEIMPSELRTYKDSTHFLTKRFDRLGNNKVHVQTLAAINPLANSYEHIFSVIRKLNLPYEDLEQQYIRMVFNVLARNVDDHSKNFAFTMSPSGIWRLSPAYDLTFSVDLDSPSYINRHSLWINGKNQDINMEDLERIALENDILDHDTLIEKVACSISKFQSHAQSLGIDSGLIKRIREDFVSL